MLFIQKILEFQNKISHAIQHTVLKQKSIRNFPIYAYVLYCKINYQNR